CVKRRFFRLIQGTRLMTEFARPAAVSRRHGPDPVAKAALRGGPRTVDEIGVWSIGAAEQRGAKPGNPKPPPPNPRPPPKCGAEACSAAPPPPPIKPRPPSRRL